MKRFLQKIPTGILVVLAITSSLFALTFLFAYIIDSNVNDGISRYLSKTAKKDWTVYQSEKLGIEITNPGGWYIDAGDQANSSYIELSDQPIYKIWDYDILTSNAPVSLSLSTYPTLPFEERSFTYETVLEHRDIFIAGHKALLIKSRTQDVAYQGEGDQIDIDCNCYGDDKSLNINATSTRWQRDKNFDITKIE